MNVVFCFNEVFVPGFISTAVSLCVTNPGAHYFYILHDGLSDAAKERISKRLTKYSCRLEYIDIGVGYFEREPYISLPRYQRLSMARLVLHKYLPDSLSRVLYLDVDLTINGSLESFYTIDLQNYFLAAVAVRADGNNGGPFPDPEADVYKFISLPISKCSPYFNAGVLLINMEAFRTINVADYDRFVLRYQNLIKLADQDILNFFLCEKTMKIVDRRLNCAIPNNMRLRRGELKWVQSEVVVLHYVVSTKPWMYAKYTNPLFHIYMKYYLIETNCFYWACRYFVWYFMKPFHLAKRCWRKFASLITR